jgi:peptide/nickel transport system substrate-binding protein
MIGIAAERVAPADRRPEPRFQEVRTMTLRPHRFFVAALATLVVALFGATLAQTTLTIARPADATDFNVFRNANNATSEVTYQVHEGLATFTPEVEIVPVLATGWELLDDDVTWRLTLREGVRFHTGNPFNAEVVKWNFDRMLNPEDPGVAAGLMANVVEVRVVDEYTVDVELEAPNGVFVALLAAPLMMMADMEHFEAIGEQAYASDPSGTGPFAFESWEPGSRIVLTANEDYWGEVGAGVDRLVFETIPEEASRVLALRTGEVDMVFGVPADQMSDLEGRDGIQVWRTPTFRTVFIGMNTQHPNLTRNVRHALSHAVNREQISAVIGDNGSPAVGHGPPEALGFYDHSLPFDVEGARALLEEDGWTVGSDGVREKDGQRLEISVLARGVSPGEVDALQVLQLQWREIGVDMSIEMVDRAAWVSTMTDAAIAWKASGEVGDHTAWASGSGIRTGEVGYLMNRPLCQQTSRAWFLLDCYPEYDEAFALSQSPAPIEERLEGYRVMGEFTKEWQHRIPLFHLQNNTAASENVEGFVINPQDMLNLRGVTND